MMTEEMMMNKTKSWIDDFHLYKNGVNILLRDCVWGVSWVGGILFCFLSKFVLNETVTNKSTAKGELVLASGCFIFSLTLLMEFGSLIIQSNEGKKKACRIIHGIFLMITVAMLFISFLAILGIGNDNWLFGLSSGIMLYFVIDIFLVCFVRSDNQVTGLIAKTDVQSNERQRLELFEKNLQSGSLGDVSRRER